MNFVLKVNLVVVAKEFQRTTKLELVRNLGDHHQLLEKGISDELLSENDDSFYEELDQD